MSDFNEGDRVAGVPGTRTQTWGAGRVTRVDGDRLFVVWDCSGWTEDEHEAHELTSEKGVQP